MAGRTSAISLAWLVCGSVAGSCMGAAAVPAVPHPGVPSAFEHAGIVYLVGIIISAGTAVMIKLLTVALRNMRGANQEQA